MRLKSNKGSALIMAMFFITICVITSVGIYAHAFHLSKETSIVDTDRLKDYYSGLAGVRYAYILLNDPVNNFTPAVISGATITGGITTLSHDNHESVVVEFGSGSSLAQKIGLAEGKKLTVTIEEWDSAKAAAYGDLQWVDGTYRVTGWVEDAS